MDVGEPGATGPIANPIDRFAHLPEPTRKFLEELREDDIDEIKEAVRFQRSVRTVSRFSKWLIITIVGTFIMAVNFGEAILKAFKWIGPGGRP